LASAQSTLASNGGDLTQVPPATIAAIDPKEFPDLQTYAGKIREGGTTTNPALYQDAVTNLPKYAAMTDAQWYAVARPNLSMDDFKTLTKQRADLINDTGSNAPGSLNLPAINDIVSHRLESMGFSANPKITGTMWEGNVDTAGASRVAEIRQFINDGLLAAQKQAGRKFNEGEIATFVDGQFARSVTLQNKLSFGLFSFPRAPTTINMLTMDSSQIPNDTWFKLQDDFAAHGVPNPTHGQMLGAYWRFKNAQSGQ
jgi:soluble lytic murein transglycosylase